MNTINTQHKKYPQQSFKQNALYCIAGLCCMCVLLYACFLLYPLAVKVQQYLCGCIGVMNSAIRGSYR